jgi:hypothetical protein
LELGFHPFVMDVDNVLVRNPFNFLIGFPICDFSAVSDAIYNKILEESEDRYHFQGHKVYINTGFIYWRNTRLVLDTVRKVVVQTKSVNTDDQDLFCRLLDEFILDSKESLVNVHFLKRHQECSRLGPMTANILPPGLFGGQKIVLQTMELARQQMTPPYVIHFGHLSGFYEKRSFMNATGYFDLSLP